MDQAAFSFLGIDDHEAYARKAASLDDPALEAWLRSEYVSKKSQAESDGWNAQWLRSGPQPGSKGYTYFIELRERLDPRRTDITSWPDLLDLDEGRDVPRRSIAA